eukprot:1150855-Pelagomonas_calceolata.AAC.4
MVRMQAGVRGLFGFEVKSLPQEGAYEYTHTATGMRFQVRLAGCWRVCVCVQLCALVRLLRSVADKHASSIPTQPQRHALPGGTPVAAGGMLGIVIRWRRFIIPGYEGGRATTGMRFQARLMVAGDSCTSCNA